MLSDCSLHFPPLLPTNSQGCAGFCTGSKYVFSVDCVQFSHRPPFFFPASMRPFWASLSLSPARRKSKLSESPSSPRAGLDQ